jgi:hypothetical protein
MGLALSFGAFTTSSVNVIPNSPVEGERETLGQS